MGSHGRQVMKADFPTEVQLIVGPVLSDKGFTLEQIDDGTDEGGRYLSVVYYRGHDCKVQIYKSAREGETNCMIAPLYAPNEFGLRSTSKKWQYLTRFAKRPDAPLKELMQMARSEYESYDDPLHWVKARVEKDFDAARAGILEMYPPSESP
jgi:hypothetical protein